MVFAALGFGPSPRPFVKTADPGKPWMTARASDSQATGPRGPNGGSGWRLERPHKAAVSLEGARTAAGHRASKAEGPPILKSANALCMYADILRDSPRVRGLRDYREPDTDFPNSARPTRTGAVTLLHPQARLLVVLPVYVAASMQPARK